MRRPEDSFLEITVVGPGRIEVLTGSLSVQGDAARKIDVGSEALLVGRHASCQLVLDDMRVSSVHAEVVGTERGVRLRDLSSKNGTFIHGVRVGEVFLTHRTLVKMGETTLLFDPAKGPRAVEEESAFGPLVGQNPEMRALFGRLRRIAQTDLTVLVGGETGTGKELVARAIHLGSQRAKGPFVVVDCGSIPQTLAEATLFGHEKGAFTGATDRRVWPFVEADGGTIFLDELGELPVDLQPKLLRALAERRIKPVGGSTYRPVDVRVVAATRRDLVREVNDGVFRSDLFFRVAEVRVDLPPLRARLDDIPALVRRVLAELGAEGAFSRVTDESLARLMRYDWPGNVRELRSAVAVTLALTDPGDPLDISPSSGGLADIAPSLRPPPAPRESEATSLLSGGPLAIFKDAKHDALGRFEREYFSRLADECQGNVSEMARRSGIERAHVRMYLRRHGLGDKHAPRGG